jgi:hypothetical protein
MFISLTTGKFKRTKIGWYKNQNIYVEHKEVDLIRVSILDALK